MALSPDALEKRYGNHAAKIESPADPQKHNLLRSQMMDIAWYLNQTLPDGRYKSLALTELENASMWAHKSIAIDATPEIGPSYDKD